MTKKSELSLMWQMKREAERDFHKFIKYVAELEKENKELKEELAECHWLVDEIDYWKRKYKALKQSIKHITKIQYIWETIDLTTSDNQLYVLVDEDTIKELKDIWEF